MAHTVKRLVTLAGIVLAFATSLPPVSAESRSYKELSTEWWQWILSIPRAVNPLLDDTGAHCLVGQRGEVWFLVGTFGAGTVTRTCAVPEDTTLFFPVINSVSVDTPGVCGQDANRIPVSELREINRAFVDGAANLSVELDGIPIQKLRRVESKAFQLAVPEDNLFDPLCPGGLPAGIYSPAVDDGFYVRLDPFEVGEHTLRFHAENPQAQFVLDVTYHLSVVPLIKK